MNRQAAGGERPNFPLQWDVAPIGIQNKLSPVGAMLLSECVRHQGMSRE